MGRQSKQKPTAGRSRALLQAGRELAPPGRFQLCSCFVFLEEYSSVAALEEEE